MSFNWGTVTGVSPLRVRLDGDTSAVPVTPDSLVDPLTLAVNDRVRVELSNNRLIVHGVHSGESLIPSGSMMDFAGAAEPSGWLLCDGRSLLRSEYAGLFATLGTVYGANDSTHFNLPDKRGRVSVGRDVTQTEFDVLGEKGGAKTHAHGLSGSTARARLGMTGSDIIFDRVAESFTGTVRFAASGGTTSGDMSMPYKTKLDGNTENGSTLQPYIALNSIIKI
jgi:microcystin-dependent protein